MTNCQDFDDLSIKRLPKMLDSIQTYGREFTWPGFTGAPTVSVVYEVLRKWDESFVVVVV